MHAARRSWDRALRQTSDIDLVIALSIEDMMHELMPFLVFEFGT